MLDLCASHGENGADERVDVCVCVDFRGEYVQYFDVYHSACSIRLDVLNVGPVQDSSSTSANGKFRPTQ